MINIGFDAKRAYHNTTGLGNYSRTLIGGLAENYPEHRYFLFNPKPSEKYKTPPFEIVREVLPSTPFLKKFSSLWRSIWLTKVLKNHQIDIFHGLSHELPRGIERAGIPSVVTMHDLIFERYPEQFSPVDVFIFRKKFRYACMAANRVIAISKQTKEDLVNMYGVNEAKIDVCYQSCHPRFEKPVTSDLKEAIRKKYALPDDYFLYVGSIIERKNLLAICKALHALKGKLSIPLVVIGNGKKYKEKVKQYVQSNGLNSNVIFLSERKEVSSDVSFQTSESLPAIYQMAKGMIYPSFYEGFGLPVLEALWSRIPVITSSVSCLPEAGGPGAFYVHPDNPEEIAAAMFSVAHDDGVNHKVEQGIKYAQSFTVEQTTKAVMNVYNKVLNSKCF